MKKCSTCSQNIDIVLSLNKKTIIIIASCKAKKIRLFPPERAGEFFLSQPDHNEDCKLL